MTERVRLRKPEAAGETPRERVPLKPTSKVDLDALLTQARRSVLTEELIHELYSLLVRGVPMDSACGSLGLTTNQVYAWRKLGDDYLESDFQPARNKIHGQLVLALRAAAGHYIKKRVRELHDDPLNWRRELEILERRDRANWGRETAAGGDDGDYNPDESFL